MKHLKAKTKEKPMLNSNFSKYDFVKSYIKNAKTAKEKQAKEEEASIIADAIRKNNDMQCDVLATKRELYGVRDELKGDIKSLRDELKGDIKLVRSEMELLRKDITVKMIIVMGSLLTFFHALEKFSG